MEIIKKFRDPLTHQANETVRISERDKNALLNIKNLFDHPYRQNSGSEEKLRKYVLPALLSLCNYLFWFVYFFTEQKTVLKTSFKWYSTELSQ